MDETAMRTVPFLASFSHLRRVRIGYIIHDPMTREIFFSPYFVSEVDYPGGHQQIFKKLLWSLCGAFKSRSLPQDVDLGNLIQFNPGCSDVVCRGTLPTFGREQMERCLCNEVRKTFPFEVVFECTRMCVQDSDRIRMIAERPGGRRFLHDSARLLSILNEVEVDSIDDILEEYYDDDGSRENSPLTLARRKLDGVVQSRDSHELFFVHLSDNILNMMRDESTQR